MTGRATSGITAVGVRGFKSLYEPQNIEIRPLTVVAGVNSSGKSSLLQPLLLMKQTLEAPFDPGPLLLDGPHVSITSLDQVLSRAVPTAERATDFDVSVADSGRVPVLLKYGRDGSGDLRLFSMAGAFFSDNAPPFLLVDGQPVDFAQSGETDRPMLEKAFGGSVARRQRCFLAVESSRGSVLDLTEELTLELARIIHLPALRGNPARSYPVVAVGDTFQGPFDRYTAGVVAAWQSRRNAEKLTALRRDLAEVALTSDVQARKLDDTRVELLVGRLPPGGRSDSSDLVNIADVGFGVSQTLPVVAALLVAERGQLVYLEQPEIHLHPRAQVAFAGLLRRAAARGVRVVVETHSSLLVRGIQTSVAEGNLDPADVVLHWCTRDAVTGYTTVTTGELDEAGAFGDWPEDFDDVNLEAEERYLDAAARKDRQ